MHFSTIFLLSGQKQQQKAPSLCLSRAKLYTKNPNRAALLSFDWVFGAQLDTQEEK